MHCNDSKMQITGRFGLFLLGLSILWSGGENGERPAVQAQSGSILIRGCEFRQDRSQILLGRDVRRAVITGNIFSDPERIENQSEGNVQIGLNSENPD